MADPGFWKGGGGQEEAEGVSCRSECGCSCNAAALGRSPSCLGGSGGMLPRKILKIQLSIYAFLRILRVSTVCQAEGNMHPSSTPIVAYLTKFIITIDCALLSIEKKKKIEARLKGGGGHGPFGPPPPPGSATVKGGPARFYCAPKKCKMTTLGILLWQHQYSMILRD